MIGAMEKNKARKVKRTRGESKSAISNKRPH